MKGDGAKRVYEQVIHYEYYGDAEPAKPAPCPACRGAGKVLLLVSAVACDACGGTGKIGPVGVAAGAFKSEGPAKTDAAGELVTTETDACGQLTTTQAFDELGRLRRLHMRFVPAGE